MKKQINLYEYISSPHLEKRIEERVFNIKDVSIPGEELDDKLKQKIKDKIALAAKERLDLIRNRMFPEDEAIIYKLIIPVLIYKGNKVIPEITTQSSSKEGKKEFSGSMFVISFIKNVGETIMNVDVNTTDEELLKKAWRHIIGLKISKSVESFPKLNYIINLDKSLEQKAYTIQTGEKSNLGDITMNQIKIFAQINPREEKSVVVLEKNLNDVKDFFEKNKQRFNQNETNFFVSKIKQIENRISDIKESGNKAVEKLEKKGEYKKGARYIHKDFGKGKIESVKKVEDGIYNIMVKFDNPIYGTKVLRVKEKDKPAVATAGLSEGLRLKIRQILRQVL